MTHRPVPRGVFQRSCKTCGWTGTYDTVARAAYFKRLHSCETHLRRAAQRERGRLRRESVDRTPKPCLHKYANHQHGTYPCYVLDHCKCPPCAAANSAYEFNRTRQQAYGRWQGLVDAQPARERVQALMAAGMGLKRIAAVTGVSTGTLSKLMYGRPWADGTVRPSRRLKPVTAEKLLAVELDLADGARVDATTTRRRLQALVAMGWSMSKLGRALGMQPGNFNRTIHAQQVVWSTAKAVHALYPRLAETEPPRANHRDRIAYSRSIGYARDHGWQPPLRIYGRLHVGPVIPLSIDDVDQVDDVGAVVDEGAVLRRLAGDKTVRLALPEQLEVVLRWTGSRAECERVTGLNPYRILQEAS